MKKNFVFYGFLISTFALIRVQKTTGVKQKMIIHP